MVGRLAPRHSGPLQVCIITLDIANGVGAHMGLPSRGVGVSSLSGEPKTLTILFIEHSASRWALKKSF